MKRFLIVAGDPSGDMIASQLVESLKKIEPNVFISSLGGRNMARVSDRFLGDIVREHALGFAISPRKIFRFCKILNNVIVPELKNNPPDAVIPVDFYGFNYPVARTAKKMGKKVFYYVSPQFWASRPGRAERLRPFVDLFLCLFPFEQDFYRTRNLPALFVGHPVLDNLPSGALHESPLRIESNVGLLPGSRPEEIQRHLPVMIAACRRITDACPGTRFLLFTVPHVSRDFYLRLIETSHKSRSLIELVQDENYVWRSQLDMAITASGMETLENTFLGIPMVVMYKTNWITYTVGRMVINIPHLAMPNLLAQRLIVPELIQSKATAQALATPIVRWIQNPGERRALRQDLLSLRLKFGEGGASERAARVILEKVA